MADSVRIVRFTAGGQIEELLNIQSSLDFSVTDMGFERDSFDIAQGDRNQRMVKRGGRYGGEHYAGESVGNDAYKCRLLSSAPTADSLLTKLSQVIAELERVPGQHYIEHQMDGATYPSYKEVRAPAKRSPVYRWAQAQGAGSMVLDIEWPVAPLACGPPMHSRSNIAGDSDLSEFEADAGAISDFVAGRISASLTVERLIAHTGRGYTYGSHQVTVRGKPGATISGFKIAARLKRIAADTYVDCYVDDNGTNSRLRIDTVNGGTRTNRATTNLGSRVSNGTDIWIRARIEYDAITVDYFTTSPVPSSTPTATRTYSLTGSDAAAMGSGIEGVGGASLLPQHANAELTTVAIRPYVFASSVAPFTKALDGDIPGDADALGGFSLAHISASGGSVASFAMFGWAGREDGLIAEPFGIYESSSATNLVDFATSADAAARGGSLIAASSFGGATRADWTFDASRLFPDESSPDTQVVEIWARVKTASVVGTLRAIVSWFASGMSSAATQVYSEFGDEGRVISHVTGDTIYQIVRLGAIVVQRPSPGDAGTSSIRVRMDDPTGGSAGIDWIAAVGGSRRAISPTGKTEGFGSTYPRFAISNTINVKSIAHDLRGSYSTGYETEASSSAATHGLGGSLIEFPAGRMDILCVLSEMVPDDPDISAGTGADDGSTFTVSVWPNIIPRWHHLRDQ